MSVWELSRLGRRGGPANLELAFCRLQRCRVLARLRRRGGPTKPAWFKKSMGQFSRHSLSAQDFSEQLQSEITQISEDLLPALRALSVPDGVLERALAVRRDLKHCPTIQRGGCEPFDCPEPLERLTQNWSPSNCSWCLVFPLKARFSFSTAEDAPATNLKTSAAESHVPMRFSALAVVNARKPKEDGGKGQDRKHHNKVSATYVTTMNKQVAMVH